MKKYILLLAMLVAGNTQAQERLTLQDAIARTLQHNFDIQVAGIGVEQAHRNNTYGNAGFSPTVTAGVTASGSHNNVRSDLANGTQQNNPNASNTNINPALTASWTIFDGGRMFLVKKQLNELEALSDIQLKAQVQAMVSRTIQMYAQVTLQQKRLIAIDTALQLSMERLKLADLKYRTGAGAKFDQVTALVDLSARRDDSLSYLVTFAQACDSLSVLMGSNEGKLYRVDDSLQINTRLQPTDKDRLRDENLSLSAYRRNAELSHLSADIARTYALPTLAINGGYVYSRSTSATGFALFSRTYGANGAVNLSMPLFAGGNLRRQAKVASLQAMRDDLLYEKQNTIIGRQYRSAWRSYTLSVAAYQLAKDNIGYAKEAVDIQSARFRLGAGTTLELRQAENDYVLALIRLYTAEYNVKVNETQVLELENKLVQAK